MCGRYILIESKWNLKNDWAKTCYQLAHDINRIKVEFKELSWKSLVDTKNILIESKWNLKMKLKLKFALILQY